MRHGLVIEPQADPKSYVFGGGQLPYETLQPDGQWEAFLPLYESQAPNGWDTFACQIFGTVKAVEILERRLAGGAPNYSERFHYNAIPIRPPGGDPHLAAESVRLRGMVPQEALPMTETFEEYQTPFPLTASLLGQASAWKRAWEFGHEWLWRREPTLATRNALLKDALRYSPVGISVTAWHAGEGGRYEDFGLPNNHWCVLVGYDERPEGLVLRVLDSYDGQIKLLAPDHRIQVAKRYHLAPVVEFSGLKAANVNEMQTYSSTQSANLAVFAGVIVTLVGRFGFEASVEDVTVVLGAIVSLVGVLRAWYLRYAQGDVTLGGWHK